VAVGGEENSSIEIPDGALGDPGNFFLLGSFGLVDAVFDARLRRRACLGVVEKNTDPCAA
jgi:hypothetical protein